MKEFIKNNYHLHFIIGVLLGLLTFLICKIVVIGFFTGLFSGTIWEGEQTYRYKNKWDWWDVIFSAIGGLIGSLILYFIV